MFAVQHTGLAIFFGQRFIKMPGLLNCIPIYLARTRLRENYERKPCRCWAWHQQVRCFQSMLLLGVELSRRYMDFRPTVQIDDIYLRSPAQPRVHHRTYHSIDVRNSVVLAHLKPLSSWELRHKLWIKDTIVFSKPFGTGGWNLMRRSWLRCCD